MVEVSENPRLTRAFFGASRWNSIAGTSQFFSFIGWLGLVGGIYGAFEYTRTGDEFVSALTSLDIEEAAKLGQTPLLFGVISGLASRFVSSWLASSRAKMWSNEHRAAWRDNQAAINS